MLRAALQVALGLVLMRRSAAADCEHSSACATDPVSFLQFELTEVIKRNRTAPDLEGAQKATPNAKSTANSGSIIFAATVVPFAFVTALMLIVCSVLQQKKFPAHDLSVPSMKEKHTRTEENLSGQEQTSTEEMSGKPWTDKDKALDNALRILVPMGNFLISANFTIVLPSVEEVTTSRSSTIAMSGYLIGAYALGCAVGLPLMSYLSHVSYRGGMVAASVFAVLGNMMYLISVDVAHVSAYQLWWSFGARVICGLEGSLIILLTNLILHCTAGLGTVVAFAELTLAGALGLSCGPWLSALALMAYPSLHPEIPPVLSMAGLGLFYGVCCMWCCPDYGECNIQSHEGADKTQHVTEEHGDHISKTSCHVHACWLHLFLQCLVNANRFIQRVGWESGVLLILMHNHNFDIMQAGFAVGIVPLGLIPMFMATPRLYDTLGFLGCVHTMEAVQVIGLALMLCAGSSGAANLVTLMLGSVLFYSGNFSTALVYGKLRSSFVVPGHWALNLESATSAIWSCTFIGYFLGPIISRALLQANMDQRLFVGNLAVIFAGLALGQEAALRVLLRYEHWNAFITARGIRVLSFVAPSSIAGAGKGRFVHDAVSTGTVMRRCVIGSDELLAFRSEDEVEAACSCNKMSIAKLSDFGIEAPGGVDWLSNTVLVMKYPGYVNHPPQGKLPSSQVEYTCEGSQLLFTNRAIRDIAAGEEVFVDYMKFGEVQWFRNYLNKEGYTTAKQFARALDTDDA